MIELYSDLYDGNYHTGENTLLKGLPWITPGAIYRVDELMCGDVPWTLENEVSYDWSSWTSPRSKSNLKVLEFGSGGSTIFFAERCQSVLSFEYNEAWIRSLNDVLSKRNIENTDIKHCSDGNVMLSEVDALEDTFDVLLVDNDWKIIPRDDLLVKAISKLNKDKALIILDNYGSPACFPVSFDWSIEKFIFNIFPVHSKGWIGEEFNSIWWGGLGTRIFHKGFFERKIIKENENRSARWFKI